MMLLNKLALICLWLLLVTSATSLISISTPSFPCLAYDYASTAISPGLLGRPYL
jgi:hypothetical protein